ncbi:hypothetical protein [Methylobacterium sp. E-046]|uniref:hypothetical protein n=1 Tax=Methylobacterium sp. E-046 TaxID=2836576 RepID=UPI001FB8F90F|nr:hypothetical protein [Methylobacterium sp. E-046]MCJ2099356.1 hypothetical protein [Methylobacterium sp. E-046]
MADDPLRMEAEVRDKFTGPLKALRSQLLDTARAGNNHSDALAKGFKSVEGAMQSTARTASSVVNPAFAALGVTGLSAGAAVAGISNALNRLTGSMASLGQLSRETGVAAKTLQEFGSVAGRFGIEQDAVASATKNFAAQMRTFSIGTGEAFRWVMQQGRDAAGRKAFQDFATDLQHTTDEGEKLKKALAFMETIRNPVERGIFAQQFFGNQDLGRIADGHLGKVVDLFKKAREKLGEFKPEDIIDAEKFDRSVSSLKSSMQRFGLTIARELLGPATEFTTWMDTLVSGERADITKSLREGLQAVKTELGQINFKQFGDDAVKGLQAGTALAGSMARAFHEIAEAVHAIREGDYVGAVRGLDGASGPLARKLAPRLGDDEIGARENVDRLTKLRDVARDASGHLIGRTQQRMGLLDTPEAAQQKLDAAQAELSRLQGRTPEQRQKDFEASEKLRKSVDALTDEMKASRGGATVSKMSADSLGGLFGDATVQTAAFGSGSSFDRRGRRLPPEDPAQREARRQAGAGNYGNPDAAWFGGRGGIDGRFGGAGSGGAVGAGRFNPLGVRPRMGPIGPRPDIPRFGGSPSGSDAGNLTALIERESANAGIDSGWMQGIRAGESGKRHNRGNPRGAYDHNPGTPGRPEDSWGPFQLNRYRGRGTGAEFEKETGLDLSDPRTIPAQVRWVAQYLRKKFNKDPRYSPFPNWQGFHGKRAANPSWGDSGYVPEGGGARAERADGGTGLLPNGAPSVLRPNSMTGAPGVTMDQANAMRTGKADGAGWAAREAARKTFEAQQADAAGLRSSGARVAATAARAGVVAMPKVENNGSVVVNVLKPGPETRVATTASGNLFQDVVQRSGAQMRRAD